MVIGLEGSAKAGEQFDLDFGGGLESSCWGTDSLNKDLKYEQEFSYVTALQVERVIGCVLQPWFHHACHSWSPCWSAVSTSLYFFCHHLQPWPFLMFLENVGIWLVTFLSTVSSKIISKLLVLSNLTVSLRDLSQRILLPVHVRFPGPCHLPDDTVEILSLESLLCPHPFFPNSLLFSSSGPCSLGT